jgi:hypothetical protein
MPFETFDLGRVIQTAEAIKGLRRQSTTDSLREQYMGEQIENMRADRQSKQRAEQVVLGKEKAQQIAIKSAQILRAPNPKNYIEQYEPVLAKSLTDSGFDWQSADDDMVRERVTAIQNRAQQELGEDISTAGPMSPQGRVAADVKRGYLNEEQGAAALNPGMSQYQRESLDIQRKRLEQGDQKPASQFRALTPEEIQRVGLPAGTSAQVDTNTGKVDVLSKRDTTATLSQKDAATARQKLTTVQMAKRQVANLRKTFEEGRTGVNAFGPGQGMLPTQAGKKFDAAIDQMRGTWTGLKRVPGVGAMSDYESRMDAAQFPSRNDYESVIEQKLQGMEDQLALLENGYSGLLSGGPAEQAPQQQSAPPAQQQGIDEAGYNSLPSGTQYRAPDGTIRTKR